MICSNVATSGDVSGRLRPHTLWVAEIAEHCEAAAGWGGFFIVATGGDKTGGTLGKERGDIKWIRISRDIWCTMNQTYNVEPATIMIYLGVCIHRKKPYFWWECWLIWEYHQVNDELRGSFRSPGWAQIHIETMVRCCDAARYRKPEVRSGKILDPRETWKSNIPSGYVKIAIENDH